MNIKKIMPFKDWFNLLFYKFNFGLKSKTKHKLSVKKECIIKKICVSKKKMPVKKK